jgi:hypothetical protein
MLPVNLVSFDVCSCTRELLCPLKLQCYDQEDNSISSHFSPRLVNPKLPFIMFLRRGAVNGSFMPFIITPGLKLD